MSFILQSDYKLQVLVTHGTVDPVLPFNVSTWTKALLEKSKHVDLTYMTHPEGHTIGNQIINPAFEFWKRCLNL